jgi:hypothetical protein
MSSTPQLAELLEVWRQQTVTEGAALRAGDWAAAQACQRAKEELQARLRQIPAGDEQEVQLRPMIQELVAMERGNRDWLASARAELGARCGELQEQSRVLKRVRGSYGRNQASSWQSYG